MFVRITKNMTANKTRLPYQKPKTKSIAIVGNLAGVGERLTKALNQTKKVKAVLIPTTKDAIKTDLSKFDYVHALTMSPIYCQWLQNYYSAHATGSDLRELAQKNSTTGFLQRKSYRSAKRVFYVTPELHKYGRKIGLKKEQLVFLPNIIDVRIPKNIEQNERFTVFMPSRWEWGTKGTQHFIKAMSAFQKRHDCDFILVNWNGAVDETKTMYLLHKYNLSFWIYPQMSHERLIKMVLRSHVILDQCVLGVFGLTTLEALACNRSVIAFFNRQYLDYYDRDMPPIINVKPTTILAGLERAFNTWRKIQICKDGPKWVEKHHSPKVVAEKFLEHIPK